MEDLNSRCHLKRSKNWIIFHKNVKKTPGSTFVFKYGTLTHCPILLYLNSEQARRSRDSSQCSDCETCRSEEEGQFGTRSAKAFQRKTIIFRFDGVFCPIFYDPNASIPLNMTCSIPKPCLSGENSVTLFGINYNDCFIVIHHGHTIESGQRMGRSVYILLTCWMYLFHRIKA